MTKEEIQERIRNKQKIEKSLAFLKEAVQTKFVYHLMNNPGHNNGYNEEQYLKNHEWNSRRNRAAKRALLIITDVLSF